MTGALGWPDPPRSSVSTRRRTTPTGPGSGTLRILTGRKDDQRVLAGGPYGYSQVDGPSRTDLGWGVGLAYNLQHAIRAGEPEPGVFGSLEPEPLEKKPVAGAAWKKKSGAGAAKKWAGSSALREDKKHKEIVL